MSFSKQVFDMLMESQYWPPEQLLTYQRSQMEQLLRHARANVPFYKNRLDCVFRRDDSIDWKYWEEIPIITREDLQNRRDEMQAIALPPGHGHTEVFRSSGSTGMPVSITHNFLEGEVSQAALFRSHHWHNVDWTKKLCVRSIRDSTDPGLPAGFSQDQWGPDWLPKRGKRIMLYDDAPPEAALKFIVENNISYLSARPSVAHAMAVAAQRLEINPLLLGILAHGEGPTEKMKEVCEQALHAPVISHYSSTECYKIAHPCPDTGNLHVNAECMFLEMVDEKDKACTAGQSGRIVITPFFNTAQPLIRFDQSDSGVFGPRCRCGRTLPVIAALDGRTNHLFELSGGRKFTMHVPARLYKILSTEILQIAQTGPLQFEVRYLPSGPPAIDALAVFTQHMRQKFQENVTVTLRELVPPAFDPAKKLMECVNELRRGGGIQNE